MTHRLFGKCLHQRCMFATYSQGHSSHVLNSHSQRDILNSAAYLVRHLDALADRKPDFQFLDVGCGPGSITIDVARRYPQAKIVGVEPSGSRASVLKMAGASASKAGVNNVAFDVAEVHSLVAWSQEKRFDVVHAHQLLQHCGNVVEALQQMKSVTADRGFVAARTADLRTAPCFPANTIGIVRSNEIRCALFIANGGDPYVGAHQHLDAIEAGFDSDKMHCSIGLQTSGSTQEEVKAYADNWAERLIEKGFVDSVCHLHGIATEKELRDLADQMRAWGQVPGAWSVFVNGEMVCYV